MNAKDFDPRYLALWKDASVREVILPIDSREPRELAVSFRHYLHRFRKAMNAKDHYLAVAAGSVTIKVEYAAGGEWHSYANDKAKRGRAAADWRVRMVPWLSVAQADLIRKQILA